MSAYHSSNTQVDELRFLNSILLRLGIPPCSALGSIQAGSDIAIVHQVFHQTLEREALRGWYCFNKHDGVEVVISPQGSGALPMPAFTATPSALSVNYYSGHGIKTLFTLRGTVQIEPRHAGLVEEAQLLSGYSVWFDVIAKTPFFDVATGMTNGVPHQFVEYCAQKAYVELAPAFGLQPDMERMIEAEQRLMVIESDHAPRRNMLHNNPHIAKTWLRRGR